MNAVLNVYIKNCLVGYIQSANGDWFAVYRYVGLERAYIGQVRGIYEALKTLGVDNWHAGRAT